MSHDALPDNGDKHPQSSHATEDTLGKKRTSRRSRGSRSRVVVLFNFLLSGVLVVLLAGAAILLWGRAQFEGRGPLQAEATLVVPRNTSLESVAGNLERAGIISDARVFEYGARMTDAAAQLKAGEYGFQPGATMRDVLDKLTRGDAILHSLTIPEGWTVRQVFDRVGAEETLVGTLPDTVAEGSLRPDTYRIQRGMLRADLIHRMQTAQTDLVQAIWQGRNKDIPLRDIGQFVTLASIVERETGQAEERPHVASVFENRLRKGMRLQSDPTIIYAVWGGAGKPANEPIRQSHIKNESPYNTYVVKGLPPGPIACPGKAALEAVANPAESDDLYFVADGNGGHVFAATLAEHNVNVKRYREIERERNQPVPATLALDDPLLDQ